MEYSSETYQSMQNEPEYIHEVVEIVGEPQDEIYVMEVPQADPHGQENEDQNEETLIEIDGHVQLYNTEPRKFLWPKPATKLMLSLVEDILPDVGNSKQLPSKNEMWKLIAGEMRKEGYSYTASQVENKFRGIEKAYKRKVSSQKMETAKVTPKNSDSQKQTKVQENNKEPAAEVVWVYCDEADEFKQEQATNNQSGTDDESKVEQTTKEATFQNTFTKKKYGDMSKQMYKTFAKMAEDRKRYHDQILEFLKRKEERGRKREERDTKKLELLELLLSKRT